MEKKYSVEEIENYTFTKAQKTAYNSLIKACERCKKVGLTLDARQTCLNAYPNELYNLATTDWHERDRYKVEVPLLDGAYISDAGADDTFYINDNHIK